MKRVAAFLVALVAMTASTVARTEPVRVLVPDGESLQYLTFWVALGAGHFAHEGLEVEVEVPEAPRLARTRIEGGKADVFVLPPPLALELAASDVPFVAVANLLANEPINLVARPESVDQGASDPRAPVAERIGRLRGLRIGVAPGPVPRLRAMLSAGNLDPDRDVSITIVPGPDQVAAFRERRVDAVFAHTPFLERTLEDERGVLVVHATKGEVPTLAHRQIHVLAVTRGFRAAHPALVDRLVRALAESSTTIHTDPSSAVTAVMARFPRLERRHVTRLVGLYEPGIPDSPRVSASAMRAAVPLFPPTRASLDTDRIDFGRFVDETVAERVVGASVHRRPRIRVLSFVGVSVALAALVTFLRRRRSHSTRQ